MSAPVRTQTERALLVITYLLRSTPAGDVHALDLGRTGSDASERVGQLVVVLGTRRGWRWDPAPGAPPLILPQTVLALVEGVLDERFAPEGC